MSFGNGWIQGTGGIVAPVQAEAVIITISDSYAIMERLDDVKRMLSGVPDDAKHAFIHVTPKEGGKALINVAHIVGFVESDGATAAG